MSNTVNASEVAQVLINGSGKVDNRDFTYEDYIYPNGRPQGESVIMDSETKEAFSVVVSSRVIDTSTYLGTTKGSKEVSKIIAPYTDYKINLLPMSSTAYKSVFYYNKDNLIDNLPNVLGEVPYGLADSREYYEMYKCLFDSTEGFVLYDTSDKEYICWASFDFLHDDEELNYINTFDDRVITASNIDVLKALLQSKYSNKIEYPVQVLQYTTDNDGNRVVNLDEVYGRFISPITFVSSDSLKATLKAKNNI